MEKLVENLTERYKKSRIRVLFIEFVLQNFCGVNGFIAGSRAEGPHGIDADTDFKCVSADIEAVDCSRIEGINKTDGKVYVMIESEQCYPGYVKLKVINHFAMSHFLEITEYAHTTKDICFNDSKYLSTVKVLQFWSVLAFKILPKLGMKKHQKVHGPCIQPTYMHSKGEFEMDYLYCIPCQAWPVEAMEWAKRGSVRCWPGSDLVQSVMSKGCYFVPIGFSINAYNRETEWRISFSVAERDLIWSLAGTQMLCYDLLKFLHQRVKKTYSEFESYVWKTALFWILEQTDKSHWTMDEVLNRVVDCVRWVSNAIKTETCGNFFIPTNNMFEGKVLGQSIKVNLVSFLDEIANRQHPIWEELLNERAADWRDDLLYKYHTFLNTLAVSRYFLILCVEEPSPAKARCRLVDAKTILLQEQSKKGFEELTSLLANHLEFHIRILEIVHKMITGDSVVVDPTLKSLTQVDSAGFSLDIFSNKLKIASILFVNGRYAEVLKYVQEANNCYGSHVAHFASFDVSRDPLHEEYPKGGLTLAEFATKHVALDVPFLYAEISVAPPAVKFHVAEGNVVFVNPLVLALHLEFLAYWYQGSTETALVALDKLHTLIKTEGKETTTYVSHVAFEILAQSYAVAGKLDKAFGLLMEARRVRDTHSENTWQCAIILWTAYNMKKACSAKL